MSEATKLSCAERDTILLDPATGRPGADWSVASSLTDPWGEFGAPRIETTWERNGQRIRDVRHPNRGEYSPPDAAPCEHYEIQEGEGDE